LPVFGKSFAFLGSPLLCLLLVTQVVVDEW